MLSGGADGAIQLFDLECERAVEKVGKNGEPVEVLRAIDEVPRRQGHRFGVTSLHFYPFDLGLFTSTSYDRTLRVWDTNTLDEASAFTFDTRISTQAISPVASHCLVAVGAASSTIRLCDLKSGADTQSLLGHSGQVLSVSWSPRDEYILTSGGTDGTVRLWDVRRAVACLASLDYANRHAGTGVLAGQGGATGLNADEWARRTAGSNIAHRGAVNGLAWTDDGRYLVNFGFLLRNARSRTQNPIVTPQSLSSPDLVFAISRTEILSFDLFTGALVQRLEPDLRKRVINAFAARPRQIGLYAGMDDGTIIAWSPQLMSDEEEEELERELEERKRKKQGRNVLDEVYRSLMEAPITFT
ncbi:WD40-repeat-containing domain protein [Kalaharituber pfeilii]|nr:WD40-repeat-containing domain protein [Kalaharituber pfeilii]